MIGLWTSENVTELQDKWQGFEMLQLHMAVKHCCKKCKNVNVHLGYFSKMAGKTFNLLVMESLHISWWVIRVVTW